MVKVLITGAVLMATLFVVGTFSFQSKSKIESLEKSQDRGKLKWYVDMAKAKGEQEIEFPAPITRYAVARNLDEAITHYHVVIAEPMERKSYAINEYIQTWYRMRIIEDLSTPVVDCTNCPRITDVPTDMLPLQEGEFLVAQSGGEVEIDGIRIISKNLKFPAFEKAKRYLLFLSLDSEKTVGVLRMGPWGAFTLDSSQNIHPVDDNLKHPVRKELETQLDSSAEKLRMRFKEKPKQGKLYL